MTFDVLAIFGLLASVLIGVSLGLIGVGGFSNPKSIGSSYCISIIPSFYWRALYYD